jgi:hypothetical protein
MGVFAKLFVMQGQARNQDGGFNLSNSLKITHAAYVALVVESLSTVKTCFPAFDPDEHLDFRASTAEIQSWARLAPCPRDQPPVAVAVAVDSIQIDK